MIFKLVKSVDTEREHTFKIKFMLSMHTAGLLSAYACTWAAAYCLIMQQTIHKPYQVLTSLNQLPLDDSNAHREPPSHGVLLFL